jgi:hypothetical protein
MFKFFDENMMSHSFIILNYIFSELAKALLKKGKASTKSAIHNYKQVHQNKQPARRPILNMSI